MDMFNKLKSAVSNVLPGNPLSRDFDIYHQVASAGPGLLWKVYSAVKKSTKEEASVYLFEKKSVDRYCRQDRDAIVELLRGGVQQLTKLRHPKILAVIHPLEESREALAFATEPVFASLANVLGNLTAITSVPKDLLDYQLYDVEIKHGLLQLTEGLGFLHNDAKILHRNLCPEAVVLTKLGAWKLSGFDFCVHSSDPHSLEPSFPFKEWRTNIAPVAQPNLDFMAPEYVLTLMCGTASDMFSLGLLIYTVFAKGKPLFECNGELSSFKNNAEELRHLRANLLGAVPDDLREHVKLLLNSEPAVRPDAAQFSKVSFFEDVGCVTLQYLDSLFQRQNIEKSNFFRGLPKVIAKLPKRVSLQRILPALFKEALNPDMVPFLLPSILLVAEQVTETEYVQQILPHLKPLFKLKEPVQVVLLFLQNMSLLLGKTPKTDIQNHVLPMIFSSLEADSPQIQELCLSIIPTFVELIEYSTLKNSLVPRIKKLCLGTSVLTVRVNCLLCLGQLLEHMDKWFVLDEILPFLPKVPTREPAVLMSILGIHKVAFEGSKLGITKDALANKVIPFLIPIAMDSSLNLSQFNAFMSLIRDMLSKVEEEHRSKLEQLDQMKQEQRSLEISRITGTDGDIGSGNLISAGQNPTMMDKFLSSFGLSGFMSSQTPKGAVARNGGSGSTSNLAADISSNSTMASTATSTPTIPAIKKTSLTLEEKQRLAMQQEQQQRLKSQPSLSVSAKATSSRPVNTSSANPSRSTTKDLTSTLMESNMNAIKSSSMSQKMPHTTYNTNSSWSASPVWSNGSNSTMPMTVGSGGGGFIIGPTAGMGSPFSMQQQGTGFGVMSMNSSQISGPPGISPQKKPDLSAFDSLMDPSQRQKPSMNQMVSMQPAGFNQSHSVGMMPLNPGITSNLGMRANSVGMMQARPPMFVGGSFGQMGAGGMQGGQLLSPKENMSSSHKSSTNSIDDLLG